MAVVVALGVTTAHAVSLGEVEIRSYLNDPLYVRIPLTHGPSELVGADCIDVVQPRGSERDAGGLPYLSQAKLRLVQEGGRRWIEVSSPNPVVEPIVGLAMQVDCPGTGRYLREYTLLLDPPLPAVLRPAYSRSPRPPEPAPAERSRPVEAGTETWRVKRGETLSRIAATLRPGDRRAQQRLIQEIVAVNPDVFPDGDPDRLPAGALLRLPVETQLARREGSQPIPAGPADGLSTRRETPAAAESKKRDTTHRLTLSTLKQTATPEAAAETARMVADTRRLILETEEQYASAEALKSRLQRLERQIELLERALSSLNLSAVAPQGNAPVANGAEAKADEVPVSDSSAGSRVATVTPPDDKTLPTPVTVSAPALVAAPTDTKPAATAFGMNNYWWWVLAFLGVGTIVFWVRLARRADTVAEGGETRELVLDELVPEPSLAQASSTSGLGTSEVDLSHKAVVFSDDPLAGLPDEPEDPGMVAEKGAANLSQEVPTLEHELTQQIEQGGLILEDFDFQEQQSDASREVSNVLVRAEFHLLLKQVESAIKLLKESIEQNEALRQEPALWLMLLRIYRQQGLQEPFTELHREFGKLFNIDVPGWGEESTARVEGQASLEGDYPRLLHRIVALWNTPNCLLFVDNLLHDDRDGTRRGFDIHIAEELLLLKGVLQLRKSL
ncbi:MAG: hypothetical protein Kow006_33290 [Gammaproteobacteria bacterium]